MRVKLTYNLEVNTRPPEAFNLLAGGHSLFNLVLVIYCLPLVEESIILAALADMSRLVSHLKMPLRSWAIVTEL
jgi:hypothetical protein